MWDVKYISWNQKNKNQAGVSFIDSALNEAWLKHAVPFESIPFIDCQLADGMHNQAE